MHKEDDVKFNHEFLRQFWNRVAYDRNSTTTFNFEIFKNFVKNKNASVLDIGCGYGRVLNTLYERGYVNSIGIDISQQMLERGQRKFPHLCLIHTDGGIPFDFSANSFDVVLLFGVLSSVIANREQLFWMSEIRRLLKVGGIVYVSDFLITDSPENVERYNKFETDDNLPYGVFQIDQDTPPFRHHDPLWIKKITSLFDELYYHEEPFNTMDNKQNNGFLYIGRNEYEDC